MASMFPVALPNEGPFNKSVWPWLLPVTS